MVHIQIDPQVCIRCDACIKVCTGRVFERRHDQVCAVKPESCWRCGHCVALCPADAIEHSCYAIDECPLPTSLPSLDQLVNAFRERRSLRLYQDRPVPREVVRELIDIARWVPSASNKQQVDWVAFDDRQQIAALSDHVVSLFSLGVRLLRNPALRPLWRLALGRRADRLAVSGEFMIEKHKQGYDPIFFNAPVVLVAHVRQSTMFGRDDAVYAAYNLMLAAQRLGLGTCQIGFFKVALVLSPRLQRSLGLAQKRQPQVALTLGYPQHHFRRALPRRKPNLAWNTMPKPRAS
jgi:nitroreductase/NAD-dependent dihydropyrimidine dehydrogenase PreA subunit